MVWGVLRRSVDHQAANLFFVYPCMSQVGWSPNVDLRPTAGKTRGEARVEQSSGPQTGARCPQGSSGVLEKTMDNNRNNKQVSLSQVQFGKLDNYI